MSSSYRAYIDSLQGELSKMYGISEAARQKGLDPALKVESIIAQDIADLVEGLVGPKTLQPAYASSTKQWAAKKWLSKFVNKSLPASLVLWNPNPPQNKLSARRWQFSQKA
jgi:hypothetical protein